MSAGQKRQRADNEPEPGEVDFPDPQEVEPPAVVPYPFSEVRTCDTLAEALQFEVGSEPPELVNLARIFALAEAQTNPVPQASKWFLPLTGWEVAEKNGIELVAVRSGSLTCSPNDVLTIGGLVTRGYRTRIISGSQRLYLPDFALRDNHVVTAHYCLRTEPFKGKDLSWLGTVLDWLNGVETTALIPTVAVIATAVLRVASRVTPEFAEKIVTILGNNDKTITLDLLTQGIEAYGPCESVFAPLLVCLRAPLLAGLVTAGKWEIIRDARYRGMSVAILSDLVTALRVLSPTPAAVMRGYYDERGAPFPVKLLREATELDFVPCGPKPNPGQSLLAVLNDAESRVSVLPSPTAVLFRKDNRTGILQRMGDATSLGLELVAGSLLANAANPRPPAIAQAAQASSSVAPKTVFTFIV